MKRGVPCADLIDFSYGYNNVFWHTPQDTVDKLSPKSLEIVGSVMLETVRILDKMEPLPAEVIGGRVSERAHQCYGDVSTVDLRSAQTVKTSVCFSGSTRPERSKLPRLSVAQVKLPSSSGRIELLLRQDPGSMCYLQSRTLLPQSA